MAKLFEYKIHTEAEEPMLPCWKVFSVSFAVCILLAMTFMLTACEKGQDGDTSGDREVTVTLQLSFPGQQAGTRSISTSAENKLDASQIKVLAFKVNGTTETFAYETPQIILKGGNTCTVTLRKSMAGESYRLVVIANAGGKLPFIAEGTGKSEALKKITFTSSGKWKTNSDSDYTPIPMWGETDNAQVISETTSPGTVTLLRALARIDVGCTLSGESATGLGNFKLKSVSVYRTKSKGYAAPVNATVNKNVVSTVSIPTDAVTNSALTYPCTDEKSLVRTIYVAEAPQGTGRDDSVCLVAGGTYGGSTNYYRIDLTSGGAYIPLKRNCRYAVNIKAVTGAGYATEADALKGDKTLIVATSISAETWGSETAAGSGTITLP